MRIVFMGTAGFAVPALRNLKAAGHDIALVVCQPDRPKGRGQQLRSCDVKVATLELGLEVFQPLKIKEASAVERIRAIQPELLCVVAYGQILPQALLDVPTRMAMNVHASLLPKYRGAAPIEWAVAAGETETGVCVQRMIARLDAGDVLLRSILTIGDREEAASLTPRLSKLGGELLLLAVERLAQGAVAFEPQDEALASYAPMLKKSHGALDFSLGARKIFDIFRAFKQRPGITTRLNQETLRVLEMTPSGDQSATDNSPAGTLRSVGPLGFEIVCGDGISVWLSQVQGPNGKAMPAADYARGHGVKPGMRAELPDFPVQ